MELAVYLTSLYDKNNKGKITRKNFMDVNIILGEKNKQLIRQKWKELTDIYLNKAKVKIIQFDV